MIKNPLKLDPLKLEEFAKAALTGLCANPVYNDQNFQKNMQLRGLTLEKMAIAIAMQSLIELDAVYEKMKKEQENGPNTLQVSDI